jgi:hypothetical protein
MIRSFAAVCAALCVAGVAQAGSIKGDYVESRTADIYTGPCFSNSEIFLTGHQAVVAWKVTEGSWDGVDLSGLSVAAAIRGTTTFSEDKPEQAQSVVIVDQRADAKQKAALIAMAKALAGGRLTNVVDVKSSLIVLTVESPELTGNHGHAKQADHAMPEAPMAIFWAPGMAEITTRPLNHNDHVCGNESVAYLPLSKGVDALPAYTTGHKFQVKGLGTTWNDPNCRSSFVGHFSL